MASFNLERPSFQPVSGPESNIVTAIRRLTQQHQQLQGADQKIAKILGINLTPGDRARLIINKVVSPILGRRIVLDPLDAMEYSLRSNMHEVLDDLSFLSQTGRQRIDRHQELSTLLGKARAGEIETEEISRMMREKTAQRADLPRIPLIEGYIEQILEEMSPEMREQMREKTLTRIGVVLETTKPIIDMINQAFFAGAITFDSLVQNYYLVTEIGPSLKALKQASADLQKSAISSLQTPELLRAQVKLAASGLSLALEGARLSQTLEKESSTALIEDLQSKATELSTKLDELKFLPQPKDTPNA